MLVDRFHILCTQHLQTLPVSREQLFVNVARAHSDGRQLPHTSRTPGEQSQRGRLPGRNREQNTNDRSRSRSTSRSCDPPPAIQCAACGGHVHSVRECRFLPKWVLCQSYAKAHPTDTQDITRQFRRLQHHPDTFQTNRDRIVNVLRTTESATVAQLTSHEIDTLATRLSAPYYSVVPPDQDTLQQEEDTADMHDDYHQMTIVRVQARQRADAPASFLHPVKYPPPDMLDASPSTIEKDCTNRVRSAQVNITRVHKEGIHLADTGATVSATGMRHILHDFTTQTKYEITGYDGVSTPAHGEGYAHVRNPVSGAVDKIFFVYTPTVSGTIVSLENHAQTHPQVHRWTQDATPSADRGSITFYGKDDTLISRYPTERIHGLYYFIQDMDFIPPPADHRAQWIHHKHAQDLACDDDTVHSGKSHCEDYDIANDTMHYVNMIQQPMSEPDHIAQQLAPSPHLSKTEKDLVHYHTWHQRLGHCSETKLCHTQKLVDGMPPFSMTTLPSYVTCRACDIATF